MDTRNRPHGAGRRSARAMVVPVGLALLTVALSAGCRSTPGSPHPMMGGGTGYTYSRLSCTPPTGLPGNVVTVVLIDMGMNGMATGTAPMGARMTLRAAPTTIPSGPVTLLVENMGWRTHELLVLPLASDASAGQLVPGPDGTVDEAGSLGEASANCAAGSGDGIPAGSASWVRLTLPPGEYELVCNLPNHYANGMYQEITVTA